MSEMKKAICSRCGGYGGEPGENFGDRGWHPCFHCGTEGYCSCPECTRDPNACPHCGRLDCVYLHGADCPTVEARWAEEEAKVNQDAHDCDPMVPAPLPPGDLGNLDIPF
jgi:hypothetical protein